MESSSVASLLSFAEDSKAVLLLPDKRQQLSQGVYCPDTDLIIITFKLTSNILGEGTYDLRVPVKRKKASAFGTTLKNP